ncbi:MAG: hypothetical protein LBU43_13085 [Candidatus Accumulibacter sp.]|jgi:tetratricopeptide (TPR) repeat protein|nr:hypothetical protein [Accumulibacter sp.]
MISPARRHRLHVTARAVNEAAAARLTPLENAKPYALMLAKLDADKRRLHLVQSVEKKIALKREMLPEYADWIDGVLEAGSGVQDDVLMHVLVWRIDAEDYPGALALAEYALKHDLKLPGQYHRTLGCLLAEEFADQALKAMVAKREANLDALAQISDMTLGCDMPDEVRAKLNKAIGLAYEGEDKPALALACLEKALTLHVQAGVKKDIERVKRTLKNEAAGRNPAPPGGAPTNTDAGHPAP